MEGLDRGWQISILVMTWPSQADPNSCRPRLCPPQPHHCTIAHILVNWLCPSGILRSFSSDFKFWDTDIQTYRYTGMQKYRQNLKTPRIWLCWAKRKRKDINLSKPAAPQIGQMGAAAILWHGVRHANWDGYARLEVNAERTVSSFTTFPNHIRTNTFSSLDKYNLQFGQIYF